MVNIRYALAQAADEKVIDSQVQQQLTDIAKALFYPDRSWPALFYHAKKQAVDGSAVSAMQDFVKVKQPNQKRDDAITVLREVRQLAGLGTLVQGENNYVFEHTVFWEHLITYFSRSGDAEGDEVSNERIRNHVRLADKDRDSIRQRALLMFLIEQEARRIGFKITDDRAALQRFRYQRGLFTQPLLLGWLKENGVNKDECLEIARRELLAVRMEQRYAEQIDQGLKAVLQQDGKYHDTVKKVAAKWKKIEQSGSVHLTEDQVGSKEQVLDWYQNEYRQVNQQFDDHIAELGFTSMRQFLNELYAEYLDATP